MALSDDMSNLRPLVAQSQPRHGAARPRTVCPGQALDHAATAARLPEAPACAGGCAGCPRDVAGKAALIEVDEDGRPHQRRAAASEVIHTTEREWFNVGERV